MEKNIKIIKITNTDLNNKSLSKRPYKKQYNPNKNYNKPVKPTEQAQRNELYTDILSSSKRVMEIIKKTKNIVFF